MNAVTAFSNHRPEVWAIFILTYLGIAVGHVPGLKLDRTGIALLGAIAMLVFGGLSTVAVIGFVNWPTILLLFGFFVLAAQLRLSGLFDLVAGAVAKRMGHPARFLLVLMLAAAAMSSVLNNDVVCFVFTPIIADALIRRRLDPVPYLVALAVASNIGAAATLVGNAQDMMIAQVAGLHFGSYLAWCIVPVLFALGCAYATIRMVALRRPEAAGAPPIAAPDVVTRPPDHAHIIKGLVILAVVIVLLFTSLPKEWVALAAAGIHLASPKFRTSDLLALVDWSVLLLFAGLFVVTGAFEASGCAANLAWHLQHAGMNLAEPGKLAVATAALSNLISNAAAVMLLVKMVPLSHATLAYVLALANSFGGSLLIVGSVANIIVAQRAEEIGVHISFARFARIGFPVTVAALAGLIAWAALVPAH